MSLQWPSQYQCFHTQIIEDNLVSHKCVFDGLSSDVFAHQISFHLLLQPGGIADAGFPHPPFDLRRHLLLLSLLLLCLLLRFFFVFVFFFFSPDTHSIQYIWHAYIDSHDEVNES